MMFRKPPPKIQDCFIKFLTTEELKILSKGIKPKDKKVENKTPEKGKKDEVKITTKKK